MSATIEFLAYHTDAADRPSYTFSSVDIGFASSSRVVAVVAHYRASGSLSWSSASIAGSSATAVVTRSGTAGSAIYLLPLASGTSGEVAITLSGTALRCAIEVYRLTGIDTIPIVTRNSFASTFSTTLDVPAGGVALAGGQGFAAGWSPTWSGLTQRSNNISEAVMRSTSAADAFASQQTGLAVSCTPSAALSAPSWVAASFGPAAGPPPPPAFQPAALLMGM